MTLAQSACRAAIVGAGIGGLAAAIALRRAGWQVSVYERGASARELGFGLVLAPNALAALRELGVSGPLSGAFEGGVEFRSADGLLLRRFSAPPQGRFVVALRSELYGALLGAAGRELELSKQAVGFDERGDEVIVRFADGSCAACSLLVGADGVHSAIRRQLHPAEPGPAPTAFVAVRGVARGVRHHLGTLSGVVYLDAGLEAATIAAGSDSVYWYFSLLARDVPAGDRSASAVVEWMRQRVDRHFQAIISATLESDMRLDDLFTRKPLANWGHGRVTLLGDAAHPVLPHTGQGAAQALEDAVALGLAVTSTGDVPAALREYERVRSKRTARIVRIGPWIARTTTTRSALIEAVRSAALRCVPERLVQALADAQADPHRALRVPASRTP